MRLSRTFLADLASRLSIVEVVSRHVRLQKAGSSWKGLCPFHQEKSPSFHVNEGRGTYHCFGCGEGGDTIAFVRKVEGLAFMEAVAELARRAGLQMPEEDASPRERAEVAHRDALHRANEVAAAFFAECLAGAEGLVAREHLDERQVPAELADRFRLGAAPDRWDALKSTLRAAGIDDDLGVEAGLLIRREGEARTWDRFRGRLMFPITGPQGKVVAFGGRTLTGDNAKYINSPETPIYVKSGALFGWTEARTSIQREDAVLVVEGYFDVLALAQAGLGHAVAPCGTALTDRQLAILRRQTRNLYLLFDADAAGQKAAFRSLELCLEQGLWPSYLSVPDGKDPDDFVRTRGVEAMRAVLKTARPLLDVFLDDTAPAPGAGAVDVDRWIERCAPLLARLSPAQRDHYGRHVARHSAVDPRVVDEVVARAGAKRASQPASAPEAGPTTPAAPDSKPVERSEAYQREILRLLLLSPERVAPLVEDCGAMSWVVHREVERVGGLLLAAAREGRTVSGLELLDDIRDDALRNDLCHWLALEAPIEPTELEEAVRQGLIRLRIRWLEKRAAAIQRELATLEGRSDVPWQEKMDLLQSSHEIQTERLELQAQYRSEAT